MDSRFVLFCALFWMVVDSASIESSTSSEVNAPLNESQTDNCTKQSDCNPLLRHALHLMNQDNESSDHSRKKSLAFKTLYRHPKIICIKTKCRCDGGYIYDPTEQICRQSCESNADCSHRSGIEIPRGPEDTTVSSAAAPDSLQLDLVAQVCGSDGLCRCPVDSRIDQFNHWQCISTIKPLGMAVFATSFTVAAVFLLLAITIVPIWTMVRKQRDYSKLMQTHAKLADHSTFNEQTNRPVTD